MIPIASLTTHLLATCLLEREEHNLSFAISSKSQQVQLSFTSPNSEEEQSQPKVSLVVEIDCALQIAK